MDLETVRRLTIQATTDGVDKATSGLNALGAAYDAVSKSSDVSAKTTDESSKRALSAQGAYDRQTLSVVSGARAQADLEKGLKVANAALAQGVITTGEHAARVDLLNQKFNGLNGTQSAVAKGMQGLQFQMIAMSGNLGLAGGVLAAFGPWGFAAAAGIGATVAAINYVIDSADKMGDKAIAVRKFSDETGFSIAQIKALKAAGADLGITSDSIEASLVKMTIQLEEARHGQGTLFDQVRAVNGELAIELSNAKSAPQAWDILAKAWQNAGNARNTLSRAVFGKGGVQDGLLLGSTASAGGLEAVVAARKALSDGSTDDEIRHWAELKIQIDETQKRIDNLMASTYTTAVLERQAAFLTVQEKITRSLIAAQANPVRSVVAAVTEGNATYNPFDDPSNKKYRIESTDPAQKDPSGVANATSNVAVKIRDRTEAEKALTDAAIKNANLDKERVGLLGSAASIEDRRLSRILDLTAALRQNKLTQDDYNRAVSSANLDAMIQKESTRIGFIGAIVFIRPKQRNGFRK
jgi:hypothetical protein